MSQLANDPVVQQWLAQPPIVPTEGGDWQAEVESIARFTRYITPKMRTVEDFQFVWALFYRNKVFIPTYGGLWVDKPSETDNPLATFELGAKLARLTYKGLIFHGGQGGSIKEEQREWLSGIANSALALELYRYLNREDGIIMTLCSGYNDESAGWSLPRGKQVGAVHVTYDEGNPFTRTHPCMDMGLAILYEGNRIWRPPASFKAAFQAVDWTRFDIIDTHNGRNGILPAIDRFFQTPRPANWFEHVCPEQKVLEATGKCPPCPIRAKTVRYAPRSYYLRPAAKRCKRGYKRSAKRTRRCVKRT